MTRPATPPGTPPGRDRPDGPGFEPAEEGARTWYWRFSDAADVVLDRPAPQFASQQAAEDWLSEHFAELAEDGVGAVSLFDAERAIFGPMPLTPEG